MRDIEHKVKRSFLSTKRIGKKDLKLRMFGRSKSNAHETYKEDRRKKKRVPFLRPL